MIIYKYIKLFIIKVNDFLQTLASALASILVGLMTLVILYMVFFRYVLNDTPYWSEEVARCMMLWMTFCILPVSYRLGSNVSLEIILKKLEGKVSEIFQIVIHLLILLFILYVAASISSWAPRLLGLPNAWILSFALSISLCVFV